MSERDVKLYLEDIELSIKKIYKYTKGLTFDDLLKDSKTIDAVVRNFEIIGEAVKNIPKEYKEDLPGFCKLIKNLEKDRLL